MNKEQKYFLRAYFFVFLWFAYGMIAYVVGQGLIVFYMGLLLMYSFEVYTSIVVLQPLNERLGYHRGRLSILKKQRQGHN